MARRPATDLFLALTPERVLAAVERAGVPCRPLCYPLNSFENRVYEVETRDRTRVIAKFYRPGRWSAEQILEEHRFLAELDAAEIPVCPPQPFPDGSTLARIAGIFYALFARRGGRAPQDLDAALATRLGRLTARLHAVGAQRDAPSRLRLTSADYLRGDLEWLARSPLLPAAWAERWLAAARAIADAYDERVAGVPCQRLHGDLHAGNLLLRDDALSVVDFDDLMVGPPAQDVWLLFADRDAASLALRDAFLSGYEELRSFDRTTLRLVEPLRGLRMAHYACWLARRWHDPIFPRTWPQFGSDEYWRGETEALEEQLDWIAGRRALGVDGERRPLDEAAATTGDSELSNKDFFWDWEG